MANKNTKADAFFKKHGKATKVSLFHDHKNNRHTITVSANGHHLTQTFPTATQAREVHDKLTGYKGKKEGNSSGKNTTETA